MGLFFVYFFYSLILLLYFFIGSKKFEETLNVKEMFKAFRLVHIYRYVCICIKNIRL